MQEKVQLYIMCIIGEEGSAVLQPCGAPCPVSRKMSNLTHLVGGHAGRRFMRQERETGSSAWRSPLGVVG